MPCQRHFTLQCDYVGRFFPLCRNFQQRMCFFFFFYPRNCAKLPHPAVVKSFALGFLAKPLDRYLTIAVRGDVKAGCRCQLRCVGGAANDLIFHFFRKRVLVSRFRPRSPTLPVFFLSVKLLISVQCFG